MSATFAVTGLLVTSTSSAILRKVLFQLQGPGLHGDEHTFEKPWFTTWESALSCWVSLIIFWIIKLAGNLTSRGSNATAEQEQPLLSPSHRDAEGKDTGGSDQQDRPPKRASHIWSLIVPGALSVMSILLQGMGLQYISASLSMMLSGSCVIFTAILSILLLKRRLNVFHISGVVLTVVGITVVSIASLIWPEPTMRPGDSSNSSPLGGFDLLLGHGDGLANSANKSGNAVIGIALTVLSTLVLAGRLVAEEFALTGTSLHPLQVLGYEGMWGTILVGISLPIVWVIPGSDVGHCEENLWDTILMLWNSRLLNGINWAFFLSVVGLNITGLLVTNQLGSVFRAVLLTSRTASVWAVDLILFYLNVGKGSVGEVWYMPASIMQLGGFLLLLLGTIVYAQGSSAIAQARTSKRVEDPEDDGPRRGQPSVNEVTRLRPYTSLFIPPGDQNWRRRGGGGSSSAQFSQSLPREAMPTGQPLSAHANILRSHSFAPGVPLANRDSQLHDSTLVQPPSSSASAVTSPGSQYNIPTTGVAIPDQEEVPYGQSPNLFLETLTHRSSWVMAPTPRRRLEAPSLGRRTASFPHDYDLHALEEETGSRAGSPDGLLHAALQQSRSQKPPEPSEGGAHIIRSISDSETLHEPHEERTGSHGLRMASPKPETLDIKPDTDTTSGNGGEGPREDGKKTLTLGRPSTTEEVSTAEQPHGEAREDENNHPNTKKGERTTSAEKYIIEQSPFAETVKDQASSSGSSNPPENKATGNLFGQSPAPDLLLLRKSTGKSKPALLPSFSEEADYPEEDPNSYMATHPVNMDSDSDISRSSSRRLSSGGSSGFKRKLYNGSKVRLSPNGRMTDGPLSQDLQQELPGRVSSSANAAEDKPYSEHESSDDGYQGSAGSDDSTDNGSKAPEKALGGDEARQKAGGSMKKNSSLQWNGEPMSL